MKRKWLAALVLSLSFLLMAVASQAGVSKNISAGEAFQMLQKDKKVFLLDVRSPQEYFQMRLDGARLIPNYQLVQRIGELPKDRPLLVYCAVGARSSDVANYLARQGYSNVYNMYGGIYAWQGRGYPVLQGPP